MTGNPRADVRMAVAVCLASVAACFAAGYSLAAHLYDRLHPKGPQ